VLPEGAEENQKLKCKSKNCGTASLRLQGAEQKATTANIAVPAMAKHSGFLPSQE
jgi:hypothetical protein